MHVIQKNYLILLILTLGASLATQAADHRIQLSRDDQELLDIIAPFYRDALKNPDKKFEPLYNMCKEEDRLQIAVYCATKNGHIKLIEQFLKKKPIQEMRLGNRSTPLHVAAKYNQADIVATLLEANANPHLTTKDGANPLRTAVECNSLEAARKLLDADKARQRADANYDVSENPIRTTIPADNSTALHVATQLGHEKMSKLLVLFNADVNAKTLIGQTPLLTAAQMGHESLAKYLINVKADPNAVTTTGISTLRFAVQEKYAIIVKALLDEKLEVQADPNVQVERDQSTCMHLVAEQGDTETAQLLLEAKADINALMDGGNTPLHLVAGKNLSHMITFLLTKGANPTIPNGRGILPHLAVFAKHHDQMNAQMIEILEAMPKFLTPENRAHKYILHDIADAIMRLDRDADASLIHRCQELINTFIATGFADPNSLAPDGKTYLDILNHKAPEPQCEQKQKTAKPSKTPAPENLALAVQLERASRQARNKEEQQRIAGEQAIIEHKRAQRAKEAKAKAGKKQTVASNQAKAPAAPIAPKQQNLEQKQEPVIMVGKKVKFTSEERKKFKQAQALRTQQAKQRTKREEVINAMYARIDKEKVEDYEAEQAQQVELFQALAGDLWNQDLGDWEQEQFWLEQNAATQDDGGPAL